MNRQPAAPLLLPAKRHADRRRRPTLQTWRSRQPAARRTSIVPGLLLGLVVLSACSSAPEPTPTEVVEQQPTATLAPTPTPGLDPPEGAILSPDESRYAVVRGGGRLIVVDIDGSESEVVNAEEITEFFWFPDSRYLGYVDRSPTDDANPELLDRLWIADVDQEVTHAIAPGFAPLLSPDGRHLAFILGAPREDRCLAGFELGIVPFNEEFVPVGLTKQSQIEGFPPGIGSDSFHPDAADDRSFPGRWRDASTLEVTMRWACADLPDQDGLYAVDVVTNQAEKLNQP